MPGIDSISIPDEEFSGGGVLRGGAWRAAVRQRGLDVPPESEIGIGIGFGTG